MRRGDRAVARERAREREKEREREDESPLTRSVVKCGVMKKNKA